MIPTCQITALVTIRPRLPKWKREEGLAQMGQYMPLFSPGTPIVQEREESVVLEGRLVLLMVQIIAISIKRLPAVFLVAIAFLTIQKLEQAKPATIEFLLLRHPPILMPGHRVALLHLRRQCILLIRRT
jgi:hypothetical protein